MRKIIILFFLISLVVLADKPTRSTAMMYSIVLGAGTADTTVTGNISFEKDSIGIMVEIGQDSISGKILYEYVSPNGYTDGTDFSLLPVLTTYSNNEKGIFTYAVPKKAGADYVRLYIIATNNKAMIQTIQIKIYLIKWR